MLPPLIFISYSHTEPSHASWVRALAARLREDGVDVILDKWDLKVGQDMYAFMEKMVTDPKVTKVAVVCDKTYTEKANAREGGVGQEVELMVKHIASDSSQQKFLALACERDANNQKYIPAYLSSRLYIDFSDPSTFDERYQELLYCLYDQDFEKKPPLGATPEYLIKAAAEAATPHEQAVVRNLEDPSISKAMLLRALWSRVYKTKPELEAEQESSDSRRQALTAMPGIECLPSCFESSELILESILDNFEWDEKQDGLPQYLGAIAAAFGANECIYIQNAKDIFDSKGERLSRRKARELSSTYAFLFKQRASLRFNQSSYPIKKNAIYVPLDIGGSDETEAVSGLLLNGVHRSVTVDDSIQIVLSSVYVASDSFSTKAESSEVRLRVYDNLKRIYRFVGRDMYERRFAAFQQQLEPVDLHFEPIVEFSHSSKRFNIFSYEALARMNGRVPAHLFETAELWGVRFQIELDIRILRKALTKYLDLLERNQSRGYNDIMPLAVNIYPSTILSENYRSELYRMLEDLGFPGHKLVLEISEKDVIYSRGSEIDGLNAFLQAKEELKRRRVKLAVDDFGTGNSSLLRVQKLMPDYVKIDRQILLYQPKVAKEIIGQLINIKDDSHNRMFSVIVEGLDMEANLNISIAELVNELEVDYIQGHLLAEATNDTPQRLNKEKYQEIQNYLGWAS